MSAPITNAASVLLSQNPGTLPNVQGALLNYFQQMSFTQIVKEVVNFKLVEQTVTTNFMGLKQPFSPQQLLLKPEGQREWKWFNIHCLPNLTLNVDDIINFQDSPYRIMAKLDYTEYGYLNYHVVQDYKP